VRSRAAPPPRPFSAAGAARSAKERCQRTGRRTIIPAMPLSVSEARQAAGRLAKILIAKNRSGEAVAVLSAWAARGPNDPEGQALLAEALQVDSRAAVAKMAFERMEGISGDHGELEAAITTFNEEQLVKLEKDLTRPVFRRAQLGFNNDLKYKGRVFHVQTEDSGLDKPHVITHLFADGGRIIKSFKRSYAQRVNDDDVALQVRALMKGQQMEMVLALRDGKWDGIIEGKEPGGMDVLEQPPNVDIQRLGSRRKSPDAPGSTGQKKTDEPKAEAAKAAPVAKAGRKFRLHVLRSMSAGGPDVYEPDGHESVIGSAGTVSLPGERFCHPREAALRWRDDKLWLDDLDGGNGAFLRIRLPVELTIGDEFIVGDQLLRIDKVPQFDHTPGPGPTYCYSSPVRISSFRVLQIFEGGAEGACILARGTTLYIGSGYNDMIIRGDPLVSEHHCLLDEQAGAIILTDLGSKTGVFVRIRGQQELRHGDEIMIGRSRLQLEVSGSA
jgi:hypothetical protein